MGSRLNATPQEEIVRSQITTGAKDFARDIEGYIEKELQKGTLVGPFDENPFGEAARFSPMNTRAKRDSQERRIILDLSHPKGKSVNSGINKDVYRGEPVSLRLPGVDALVDIILKKGKACLIFPT